MELCGADINIAHVSMATEHLDMWETLIGSRKSPLKQAGMIGLGLLWQVFTKSITLDELVVKISKRIGINGRAIIWPYAEACMDVDKPHQLELLRKDMEKQQKKASRKTKAAAKSVKAKTAKTTKSIKTKPKPKTAKAVKPKPKTSAKAAKPVKPKTKPKAKPKKK